MFVQEKNINCFCISLAVLSLMILSVEGVPPSMCFENFNHKDCGLDPTPVFYHYKPGSRCEVGFWRGCKPNLNMFRTLEDCVMTCIFAPKAHAQLYHLIDKYYKRNMGFASEERHREKPWLNEENVDTEEHESEEKQENAKTDDTEGDAGDGKEESEDKVKKEEENNGEDNEADKNKEDNGEEDKKEDNGEEDKKDDNGDENKNEENGE